MKVPGGMRILGSMIGVALLAGCAHEIQKETELHARAVSLARECGIIDTHIDAPLRLHSRPTDVAVRSTEGEFDYERAREGGLRVPFMAIYVASETEGTGRAKPLADTLIDIVEGIAQQHPDRFAIVRSVDEVRASMHSDRVLLAMGLENGSPLEGDLASVKYFYDRGIRYITLAHAKWNHLCDAAYDTVRHWGGLSPFGRRVIAEMNRLGIMIDVSHLTDSAFSQILRLSKAPVIASHSSCRYFTPGFERNIDDDMIRSLAAGGGVVQVNFGSFCLTQAVNVYGVEQDRLLGIYLDEHTSGNRDSLEEDFLDRYHQAHPMPHATIADLADHIDHIVKLVGIDYVGIGSDYEGVGHVPDGMDDVSRYPNLIEELLRRGYTDDMIRKICAENLLRVWSAVERVARQEGQHP